MCVTGLSRAQANSGHSVAVFAITPKTPIALGPVEQICVQPGLTRFGTAPLQQALEAWRPDILHLHSVYVPAHAGACSWARTRGIPYVVTPHGGLSRVVRKRRRLQKIAYDALIQRSLLNRAAFIHSVGDQFHIESYAPTAPILYAPNALSEDMLANLGNIPLRRPTSMQFRSLTFLFLGRLDPFVKGLDLLIQGFAAAALDGAKLILAGPSHRQNLLFLQKLAHRSGCEDAIVFWGNAETKDKFRLFECAHVYVQVSRSEGSSFAVLEAAAAGLPMVLSDAADPMGTLATAGASVRTDLSVPAIAKALNAVAAMSPHERIVLGGRARQAVETQFRWAKSAAQLTTAYERSL